MSTPIIITGKITGYAGIVGLPDGTQGYTTGSVSYTIRATIPGLTQPVEFNGQNPKCDCGLRTKRSASKLWSISHASA